MKVSLFPSHAQALTPSTSIQRFGIRFEGSFLSKPSILLWEKARGDRDPHPNGRGSFFSPWGSSNRRTVPGREHGSRHPPPLFDTFPRRSRFARRDLDVRRSPEAGRKRFSPLPPPRSRNIEIFAPTIEIFASRIDYVEPPPCVPPFVKSVKKKAKSATHVRCFARSSRRLERPRAPFEERGRRRKAQERIRKARLRSKRNTREGRPALRRGPARDGKYLLERRRRRLKQRKRDERREKNLGSGGNGEATRRDQTHGRDGKHTYNPKKRKDRHQVAHGDALLGVQVDFQAALRNVQD